MSSIKLRKCWEYEGLKYSREIFPKDGEAFAWPLFAKASKVVLDKMDKAVRIKSGITLSEFEVLLRIESQGGRVRFIDLSRALLLSQSRISRQMEALRTKGMINREVTDTDRRATYATLTAKGRIAFERAIGPFLEHQRADFLDRIPKEDLEAFNRVLSLLVSEPGTSLLV